MAANRNLGNLVSFKMEREEGREGEIGITMGINESVSNPKQTKLNQAYPSLPLILIN